MSLALQVDTLSAMLATVLDPLDLPGPLAVPSSVKEVSEIFRLVILAMHKREQAMHDLEEDYEKRIGELEEELEKQLGARECAEDTPPPPSPLTTPLLLTEKETTP